MKLTPLAKTLGTFASVLLITTACDQGPETPGNEAPVPATQDPALTEPGTSPSESPSLSLCEDADLDGHLGITSQCGEENGARDCDDNDPTVFPAKGDETLCGDLIDNDCDGVVDDGCACADDDGDGYFAYDATFCPLGDDCDDTNPSILPPAHEICGDGVDQNCDGQVDEDCCVPDCAKKACGADGCGGQCGVCGGDSLCEDGVCVAPSVDVTGCEGACGDYDSSAACQCDSGCFNFGDCCEDICLDCGEDFSSQCSECTPDCQDKTCGDDGCGGTCGACPGDALCDEGAGTCENGDPEESLCDGLPAAGCCADDVARFCSDSGVAEEVKCDKACGWIASEGLYGCTDSAKPDPAGVAPMACSIAEPESPVTPAEPEACVPDCQDKECGGDGCGGTCGSCPGVAPICTDGGFCALVCEADCKNKECGPDGCGGTCGGCPAAAPFCSEGGICEVVEEICTPTCEGKTCGEDGCGGSCGTCKEGAHCDAGLCIEDLVDVPTEDPPKVSCEGTCGDFVGGADCQCDAACFQFGDCCEDVCESCGDGYPAKCGCLDEDGDGYGVGPTCAGADCNDKDSAMSPIAEDVCEDGIDQDCDGLDLECPGCDSNSDCEAGLWCEPSTAECVTPKIWEWWAPTIYLDTREDHPNEDFFTSLDFDGDLNASNNGNNALGAELPAVVYGSFVSTETHWYLGYHLYFPRRYGAFLGHDYENAMRGVLLVIRIDEGYGQLEAMVTTSENGFHYHLPENSPLVGGWTFIDGEVQWDDAGDHPRPMIYVHPGDHRISGNEPWSGGGESFPGGTGVVSRWGYQGETPGNIYDDTAYELISLEDTLWAEREQMGEGEMFQSFGVFGRDDASWNAPESLAPWAYSDAYDSGAPAGELLWDPATAISRNLPGGWGTFGVEYDQNPYAVRVDLWDLLLKENTDGGFGTGDPDIYINLYMRDGRGAEHRVLGSSWQVSSQNVWSKDEAPLGTVFNLKTELERYWFYGLAAPDFAHFGIEIRDADAFGDDWVMDPAERWYGTMDGIAFVDFIKSDMFIEVTHP